ncbi:MAG: YihY/virulence factor BrkB family protein [Bacteroidota bacterium]|nr:YihY/virulence factor BrkB family protein [Bacteroidota bacterium]MDP4231432.1 YihY/virulence factor BrkB family protein [Bacteroidota bacterium]MDP4237087.1 YihY/virulence factor BrkB family protein [Bacteroidota bacterium]
MALWYPNLLRLFTNDYPVHPILSLKENIKYYTKGLWNGLDADHCFIFASGIAFNVLLCIIPLSLILFQIFSLILQNNESAKQAVFEYIQRSLPIENYGQALRDWVQNQFAYVSNVSYLPGIIALVVLLWLASALFSSLRSAVNGIFKIPTHHNMAVLKIKDIGMIFVVSLFLLLTILFSPLVTGLQKMSDNILPAFLSSFVHSTLSYLIPLGITILLFLYLYHSLPHRRIPWRVSILSTLVTVGLIEVMKYVFVFYLDKISNLGAVYGAYAFLVAIAFWAYYVGLVFTIGAEVGKLYRDKPKIEASQQ